MLCLVAYITQASAELNRVLKQVKKIAILSNNNDNLLLKLYMLKVILNDVQYPLRPEMKHKTTSLNDCTIYLIHVIETWQK